MTSIFDLGLERIPSELRQKAWEKALSEASKHWENYCRLITQYQAGGATSEPEAQRLFWADQIGNGVFFDKGLLPSEMAFKLSQDFEESFQHHSRPVSYLKNQDEQLGEIISYYFPSPLHLRNFDLSLKGFLNPASYDGPNFTEMDPVLQQASFELETIAALESIEPTSLNHAPQSFRDMMTTTQRSDNLLPKLTPAETTSEIVPKIISNDQQDLPENTSDWPDPGNLTEPKIISNDQQDLPENTSDWPDPGNLTEPKIISNDQQDLPENTSDWPEPSGLAQPEAGNVRRKPDQKPPEPEVQVMPAWLEQAIISGKQIEAPFTSVGQPQTVAPSPIDPNQSKEKDPTTNQEQPSAHLSEDLEYTREATEEDLSEAIMALTSNRDFLPIDPTETSEKAKSQRSPIELDPSAALMSDNEKSVFYTANIEANLEQVIARQEANTKPIAAENLFAEVFSKPSPSEEERNFFQPSENTDLNPPFGQTDRVEDDLNFFPSPAQREPTKSHSTLDNLLELAQTAVKDILSEEVGTVPGYMQERPRLKAYIEFSHGRSKNAARPDLPPKVKAVIDEYLLSPGRR